MTRIAVISDIHSNADSLHLVLNELKTQQVEMTICLGDLLTYGTKPNEVINLLLHYQDENRLIMIKGNHDQFYFDILNNNFSPYLMSDFVLESIHWTATKLIFHDLESLFNWRENFIFEDIYFSHANPFEYGDWRYVEKPDLLEAAFLKLDDYNCRYGVFGHSHRQSIMKRSENSIFEVEQCPISNFERNESLIINAGSLGQPRGRGYSYCLITLEENEITIDLKRFEPDVDKLIDSLNQKEISIETKSKLAHYLRS